MKKFTLIFTFVVMTVASFGADFGERIKVLEGLIAENPAYAKSGISVRIELLKMEKQPESWTELKTVLANISKKQGITRAYVPTVAAFQVVMFDYEGKFVFEAFEEAKRTGSFWTYHIIRRYKDKLNLTAAQLEQILLDTLCKVKFENQPPNNAALIVDMYIKLLPDVEEAKAKEGLKKINRIFSPYLLKNKTAWEPIVASIRTALETY